LGKLGDLVGTQFWEVGELIVPQERGALSNGVSLLEGTDGRGPGNGWRGDGRGRAAPGVWRGGVGWVLDVRGEGRLGSVRI